MALGKDVVEDCGWVLVDTHAALAGGFRVLRTAGTLTVVDTVSKATRSPVGSPLPLLHRAHDGD